MVLVTGAAGFVGRFVVKALREAGHPVRALVHTGREEVLAPYGAELSYGDMLDVASLQQATRGADAVVHLVAIIRERGSATFQAINRQGTVNVVAAARETGVRRFVYMSALGAQDQPRYPYLYSKWQAEQAVMQSGIPYVVLRPSLQFGPGDEFFNMLAGMVKALPLVPVAGSGKARFQPISVEDVARCVEQALASDSVVNTVVEIGGPEHLTYQEIVDSLAATLGVKRLKAHVPLPLMRLSARLLGLLLSHPPVTRQQLDMLEVDSTTDLDAVERHFGFRPHPLRGNVDYVRQMSRADALKATLGTLPRHIRDH